MDFLGSGWKFPVDADAPESGSGPINQIADSADTENIKESVRIILGTSKGERVMRPDLGCGINELVFEVINTTTISRITFHIKEALRKWEPRIEVVDVAVDYDYHKGNELKITITYLIRSSNKRQNLVYPFYLEQRNA